MVKFEELVGSQGGGSAEAQKEAVERVARHLGVGLEKQRLALIQESLFGSGRTFRKGRAGGWREEFSEEHKKAIKDEVGDLLVELGYEDGMDW